MPQNYKLGQGSTGRTNKKMPPRGAALWDRVVHYGWTDVIRVPELGPCRETHAPLGGGYHRIAMGKSAAQYVHRISYEQEFGEIAEGFQVLHRCDNHDCILPDHLFLGTIADNMQDKMSKGRQAKGEAMGPARLTEAGVREIREALNQGRRPSHVAREYQVSPSTIFAIRDRKTWAWLD